MAEIVIRTADENDLPAMLALYAQPDMDDLQVMTIEQAAEVFRSIKTDPHHEVFVALEDNEIVGTFSIIVIQMLSHKGDRMGILEDVVVKTERQGTGIGGRMMEFANQRCKELGCYKIMLSSGVHRERAHAFYEKLGFRKHGYSFLLE